MPRLKPSQNTSRSRSRRPVQSRDLQRGSRNYPKRLHRQRRRNRRFDESLRAESLLRLSRNREQSNNRTIRNRKKIPRTEYFCVRRVGHRENRLQLSGTTAWSSQMMTRLDVFRRQALGPRQTEAFLLKIGACGSGVLRSKTCRPQPTTTPVTTAATRSAAGFVRTETSGSRE